MGEGKNRIREKSVKVGGGRLYTQKKRRKGIVIIRRGNRGVKSNRPGNHQSINLRQNRKCQGGQRRVRCILWTYCN